MRFQKSATGQVAVAAALREKKLAKFQRERAVAAANPAAMKQARRDAYYASLPPDVALGRKFRP